jgi:aspartyl-tRNA synthetase
MKVTERIIQVLWQTFFQQTIFEKAVRDPDEYTRRNISPSAPLYFPQISYDEAMKTWGSDKPDTRLGAKIRQVQDILDPALKSMITSLEDPVIDLLNVKTSSSPEKARKFISSFLDNPSAAAYMDNPHGAPGIFIFDPSRPMSGLSSRHPYGTCLSRHCSQA